MPLQGPRRAELTVILAESYVAEKRYEKCIELLESLPYFVNWEGQDITWRLFNQAHLERGRQRLDSGDAAGALADFDAALTYPANLNVGRSNQPIEAPAQFWRGQALRALNRLEEARAAWQAGADGADVAGRQNEYREKCRDGVDAAEQVTCGTPSARLKYLEKIAANRSTHPPSSQATYRSPPGPVSGNLWRPVRRPEESTLRVAVLCIRRSPGSAGGNTRICTTRTEFVRGAG